MGQDSLYIGVDLGGTGMKGAVVDRLGQFRATASRPTPTALGREGILASMRELIGELIEQAGPVEAIGIASAGSIDREAGVVLFATSNLPGWTGVRLADEIQGTFGLPVFIDNDVNAAAQGEGWLGAAAGHPNFAYLAMGTGVGGAIAWNGQVIPGVHGGAGEVGHIIVEPGGRVCNCGQKGCLEQYTSGTALTRDAAAAVPGWDSRKLLQALAEEDPRAVGVVEAFVFRLAVGLVNIQRVFDPELIILGGGVGETYDSWSLRLERAIEEAGCESVKVKPAVTGNRAGILGAARYAMTKHAAIQASSAQTDSSSL
ncbi:ROK family protein [Paenibacillus sp. CC-CFT747]|nr:ROK family protein [Paenibacillus sp. CC-CFT747]